MENTSALAPTEHTPLAELARAGFLSRYTDATRALYEGDLRIFYGWCRSQGLDPLALRRPQIEAFGDYLVHERANSPVSVKRRLQTVRSFYRLCTADEYIDRDPTLMLRLPRTHREVEKLVWLDRFQVGALLREAERTSPAHHALVALMTMGGLRVSAACSARLENVYQAELGQWRLSVIEKGHRPHHAQMPPQLLRIIETARDGREDGPIVLRRNGTAQDRNGAYAWIRTLGERAGVGRVHPHALRRAAISAVIDSGASMQTARDFAGHAETSTTELYHPRRGQSGVQGAEIAAAVFAAVA